MHTTELRATTMASVTGEVDSAFTISGGVTPGARLGVVVARAETVGVVVEVDGAAGGDGDDVADSESSLMIAILV